MFQASFTPVKTADGSDTLYSSEMDESYHSLNGAVQESLHVFINAGLNQLKQTTINVFEVGFGTGLNALLTWHDARINRRSVFYESIEAFPLPPHLYQYLNYLDCVTDMGIDAFKILHECQWEHIQSLETNCFQLLKRKADFTTYTFNRTFDVVYYDAFSPDKQPSMWEDHLFEKVYEALNPGGLLVTYCAKGDVRRKLQRAGFITERMPGPPGKREMLRAIKKEAP